MRFLVLFVIALSLTITWQTLTLAEARGAQGGQGYSAADIEPVEGGAAYVPRRPGEGDCADGDVEQVGPPVGPYPGGPLSNRFCRCAPRVTSARRPRQTGTAQYGRAWTAVRRP